MDTKINFYTDLEPYLSCKDYTLSGEIFQIKKNLEFDMLVTIPVPNKLADYYKSEDYISHTDSKKTVYDKLYQAVKSFTLKRKLKLINSFKIENKNLLDIGAGTGDFLKVCRKSSWQVYGTEPDLGARNIAKAKGIDLNKSLSELPNKKFDVITLWHVLEHVENLQEYITTLHGLLAKDGKLIIAVPNYKSYDANYYKQFWAAFDVPRHLWHFSQQSITKLFSLENMIVEKILPMKFDAYYVSLLSEKYRSKKMKPFKSFYKGFLSNYKAARSKEYSSLIYILRNQ